MKRLDEKCSTSMTEVADDTVPLLIIADKSSEGFLDMLTFNGNVRWDKYVVRKGIDSLRAMILEDEHRKRFYKYVKVVLLIGLGDILAGGDGFRVASMLNTVLPKIKELEVEIAICQIPPATGTKATDVRMFNRKIGAIKDIQIIDLGKDFDKMTDDQIFQIDGNYRPEVNKIIISALVDQISVSKLMKPKKPFVPLTIKEEINEDMKGQQNSSDESDIIEKLYPIDGSLSGLIIGFRGQTIRNMEKESGARLSVIDWKDDKAILVRGSDSETIDKAIQSIESVIKGAKDRKKRTKEAEQSTILIKKRK